MKFTLETPSALPGGVADVSGSGCAPGETVTFHIAGASVGTATADGSGSYQATLDLPALPIGRHVVDAACGGEVLSRPIDLVVSTQAVTGPATTTVGIILLFVILTGLLLLQPSQNPRVPRPAEDSDR